MKNIENIKISPNTTIKEALSIISNGAIKIAIAANKNGKLLGTLTDGDIRRGFLKGLNLNSKVSSIIFRKPVVAKITDSENKIFKISILKKIYQIPIVDKNQKVLGIHILDELLKLQTKSNRVIIMAGGKGMRMRPLTKDIPKSMLKVGNKPILQIIIERFKESGFENFTICVNYKSQIIKNYFADGKKFNVKIEYINEKKRMGTAGALSLFKKKLKEPFFLINGDLLTNLDFEKMLDFHYEHNAKATMCIKEFNVESPYGEVVLRDENIQSIEEKPKHKFFINAGVYILDPKCMDLIPKKFYDITTLFKKMISKKYKTISFPLGEYWLDIGRPHDYNKANVEFNEIFK